jgi:hypothetical protein
MSIEELFQGLVNKEDALFALEWGYYDTHDLNFIQSNKYEYEQEIKSFKIDHNIPDKDHLGSYKVVNNQLVPI